MSATKIASKNSDALNIERLAIIAGGGELPEKLILACEHKGIKPFIVAFDGHTDPKIVEGQAHMWARLGAAGAIMKTLKSHDIADLVLIGSIRRPSLKELKPDLKTAEFFARVGMNAFGDHDFLSTLRTFLEDQGFAMHGVHKFVDELLAPEGVLGKTKPKKGDWIDIDKGLEISQALGDLDVGQSVIVQEGFVLGVEAVEGTDELIKRCGALKRKGRGGVLVKTCKPQQDRDMDLPTIGPKTVEYAAQSGLAGVVVHAGASLMLAREDMIALANKHKIFVMGIAP